MYQKKQYILNKKQSIIFEIFEVVALFLIVIYYLYINNKILAILYFVPFIEHIRQISFNYRQKGGSLTDYITLFYFFFIMLYSIHIHNKLSIAASVLGIVIHIITITTKTAFAQLVSLDDIKKSIIF